jgi:hypothetical protein
MRGPMEFQQNPLKWLIIIIAPTLLFLSVKLYEYATFSKHFREAIVEQFIYAVILRHIMVSQS